MVDEPLMLGPMTVTTCGLWGCWAHKEFISCHSAGCKNHPRALGMGLATPCLIFFVARNEEGKKQHSLLDLGVLNVRGCGMDEKKCMVVNVFKERKLDIMALSETKVKGSGLREWEGQRVIVSGVSERCRAREGVAVMISGRMWGKVVDYKCLDSRIMWVKLKLDGEIVVVMSVYAPGMEKKEDERERFWARFSECIGGFESNERVIVLGDMNAKVGDREREGIVGKFGVPGTNENGVACWSSVMKEG